MILLRLDVMATWLALFAKAAFIVVSKVVVSVEHSDLMTGFNVLDGSNYRPSRAFKIEPSIGIAPMVYETCRCQHKRNRLFPARFHDTEIPPVLTQQS